MIGSWGHESRHGIFIPLVAPNCIIMKKPLIIISFLLLSSLSIFLPCCVSQKKIKVIGMARNDYNIAIVRTKDRTYYLRRVIRWDSAFLDKEVKVTGKLLFSKYKPDTIGGYVYHSNRPFDMYWILKPKWKLVK